MGGSVGLTGLFQKVCALLTGRQLPCLFPSYFPAQNS
jgi:hypothetical protein